jgi:hypothetical protein
MSEMRGSVPDALSSAWLSCVYRFLDIICPKSDSDGTSGHRELMAPQLLLYSVISELPFLGPAFCLLAINKKAMIPVLLELWLVTNSQTKLRGSLCTSWNEANSVTSRREKWLPSFCLQMNRPWSQACCMEWLLGGDGCAWFSLKFPVSRCYSAAASQSRHHGLHKSCGT